MSVFALNIMVVSIHAPVKGATYQDLTTTSTNPGFNPRPREGGDPLLAVRSTCRLSFQSTPP